MTKGDRWKVRQGWRSLGWAIQPSSGEPDTGEPDARKRACPVREGAVGFPWSQGAGRLPHTQATAFKLGGASAVVSLQPAYPPPACSSPGEASTLCRPCWGLSRFSVSARCGAGLVAVDESFDYWSSCVSG